MKKKTKVGFYLKKIVALAVSVSMPGGCAVQKTNGPETDPGGTGQAAGTEAPSAGQTQPGMEPSSETGEQQNALYGGSANSKLFLNVREKLSLCYYASSMLDKVKGLMVVSSGVEFAQFDRAQEALLDQLEADLLTEDTEEETE